MFEARPWLRSNRGLDDVAEDEETDRNKKDVVANKECKHFCSNIVVA